jgi:hypothetical protein
MADSGDLAERARQRALVRRGYDTISLAYRGDVGAAAASSAEDVTRYAGQVAELAGRLPPGSPTSAPRRADQAACDVFARTVGNRLSAPTV